MDPWKAYREHHLSRLEEAKRSGEVDIPIIPLLDLLNSNSNIVTTSSCSGRIILLATDEEERKESSYFYRKWHRPVMVEEVTTAVREFQGGFLWFKLDPLILHVATNSLDIAFMLVETARRAGIKIAGVQTNKGWRYNVEIRGIDAMSVPLFWNGEQIIGEEQLVPLTLIANKKLVKNQKRLQRLYDAYKNLFNKM